MYSECQCVRVKIKISDLESVVIDMTRISLAGRKCCVTDQSETRLVWFTDFIVTQLYSEESADRKHLQTEVKGHTA